ncbi:MAG TPA: hypothetical protein VFI77_05580 [Gemmatimonadales bacterium]|jgi:hypothetical protein|nr:hypothetical protein [Gemmatimonadales bacterium]
MSEEGPILIGAAAVLYRLFDVGYEIDLTHAATLLAPAGAGRSRPRRGDAAAIVMPRPPVRVELEGGVTASLYDFGVVSLRLQCGPARDLSWAEFVGQAVRQQAASELRATLDRALEDLIQRIRPAVSRPALATVTEEYFVFRARGLRETGGGRVDPAEVSSDALARLLLNEPRTLAPAALRDLLPHRFSYTIDDFVVLSWEAALVIEPDADDDDVEYVLEFANAQLLELRFFDALLDDQLPRVYDRMALVRRTPSLLLGRRYRPLLADVQTFVADTTDIVERVENAFKVTEDVYLARIYLSAMEIFRAAAWRGGIDRKLGILRDTYGMLNAESQAARGEALEVAVVLLILSEIVLSLIRT